MEGDARRLPVRHDRGPVGPAEILVHRQRAAGVVDDDAGRVEGARRADQGVGVAGGGGSRCSLKMPQMTTEGWLRSRSIIAVNSRRPWSSRRGVSRIQAETRLGVDEHAVLVGQVE